ncbi:glycosyltransferase family 2 protein [Paracoccus suum]|uniref:Glycosyltransferase family 2 protein n=1 Tax=Paracoccus suum TaxID=2259340 RepID=A0A344PH59_9RHOB|nr:glycosyltransferase family 2 protein [Paracoccus suum]AXC48714.1 glycosyltransferase family 2 protein [Paracoccus suum]
MGLPPTSVIIVSRHRPDSLALCLLAMTMQDHPLLEVVLVADPASLAVRPDLRLKRVACDVANISVARNRGIAAASGEVLAFIDDDAVAEPTWAARLAAAFADPKVIAAGGYTRGPHGRSWQVRAEAITPNGPQALPTPPPQVRGAVHLFSPADGITLGLLGTNCAFRAGPLREVGGFDSAFPYHLDESDLVMRLAARFPRAATALVPAAEVIHGTAPSDRRDAARVPRDLTCIGRSEAIFTLRHGGDSALIEPRQRRRLVRHMLAGRLDPLGVGPRLASLRIGMADGFALRRPPPEALSTPEASELQPMSRRAASGTLPAMVLSGPWRRRRALRRKAARVLAEAGADKPAVTVLLLMPGILPHRICLTPGGWWEQSGGTQGPSLPDDPVALWLAYSARIRREAGLIVMRRNQNHHMTVACPTDELQAYLP